MAISFPLSHPATPGLMDLDFSLVTQAGQTRSEFTGQQQITQWQGQWWEAEGNLPPMKTRAIAEPWEVFLSSLDGIVGTFLLGPETLARTAQGTATGVTVSGAGQTGNTIALAGTGTLVAGDYIQLGTGATSRLHKIMVGGTFPYTADIRPRLRESPADASAVVVVNPKGVFRLAENIAKWNVDRAKMYGIRLRAVEAI